MLLRQDTSPLDIAKPLVIWPILYLPLCHFLVSPLSLTFPLATDKNILLSAKSSLAYLLCLQNLFCSICCISGVLLFSDANSLSSKMSLTRKHSGKVLGSDRCLHLTTITTGSAEVVGNKEQERSARTCGGAKERAGKQRRTETVSV